jgi:acyl dehydratase
LVMAWLGQAITDVIPSNRLREYSTRFVSITQLGAEITCTGTVTEMVDRDGERCARLELRAVDQHGDVKLNGTALISI